MMINIFEGVSDNTKKNDIIVKRFAVCGLAVSLRRGGEPVDLAALDEV